MAESDVLLQKIIEAANLAERLKILETEGADKDKKIEMLLLTLREKDEQIGNLRVETNRKIFEMEQVLQDTKYSSNISQKQIDLLAKFIQENIHGEPSQSESAVECAIRLLREWDAKIALLRAASNDDKRRITDLEEALRKKMSEPMDQARFLNAELRADLDKARRKADENWALVSYAWAQLTDAKPESLMSRPEDFKRIVDAVRKKIQDLQSKSAERDTEHEEWVSYREQTVRYAWEQLAYHAIPVKIMTATGSKTVDANELPSVDAFRRMVLAARYYIHILYNNVPIQVIDNCLDQVVAKVQEGGGFPWNVKHAKTELDQEDLAEENERLKGDLEEIKNGLRILLEKEEE